MFIPSCFFYTFTCLLKIPNAITNSFATVEMFRDVSYKKIQREIYFSTAANLSKKKYTSDSRYVVSIPFLNISPVAS